MANDRKPRASVKQSESEAEAAMMGLLIEKSSELLCFVHYLMKKLLKELPEIMYPKFDWVTETLDDALKYIDYVKRQIQDKDTKIHQLQKEKTPIPLNLE